MTSAERILFVHAHPDDETIDTGGTIATLIRTGAKVTVLTCTRGERGEVIPDDLQPALESRAAMATLREGELAAALKALGVTDSRFLGADNASWNGRASRVYVDSGMRWGKRGAEAEAAGESDPATLTAADLTDVAADVASVIIAVGADAVVSYDDHGGYGHPDHVRAHDAARRAADTYGVPFYTVVPPDGDRRTIPTLSVDVSGVLDQKKAALAAYRSQLTVEGDEIVLSGGQRVPIRSVEQYVLVEPAADDSIAFADQHPATRFAVTVLAGLIGAGFGGLLSVYNQLTEPIAGQPVWVGAIAAIGITAALFAGFRLIFETRVVPGFAAIAMIVVVGILSLLGAGGSVIIPWNGPGILWQIAPAIIAAVVLLWPQRSRPRPGRIVGTQSKGSQH
jgi:N-acetyl-1-D-myo-inositol-2-amino-2-deoxy-alpha-D-glucopyranoside deacetylase